MVSIDDIGILELECKGVHGKDTTAKLDGKIITNCQRIELDLDAGELNHAAIYLVPRVARLEINAKITYRFLNPITGEELVPVSSVAEFKSCPFKEC